MASHSQPAPAARPPRWAGGACSRTSDAATQSPPHPRHARGLHRRRPHRGRVPRPPPHSPPLPRIVPRPRAQARDAPSSRRGLGPLPSQTLRGPHAGDSPDSRWWGAGSFPGTLPATGWSPPAVHPTPPLRGGAPPPPRRGGAPTRHTRRRLTPIPTPARQTMPGQGPAAAHPAHPAVTWWPQRPETQP